MINPGLTGAATAVLLALTAGAALAEYPERPVEIVVPFAPGGAGDVFARIFVNAINENIVPPTAGYREPDPECDLDVTPNVARERTVDVVLSNAFAFGGTNAVLAFKREGYSRWDINSTELMETLSFPGFQKIARRYWRDGLGEMYRSYSKQAFVKALQHLIPEVGQEDLRRGGAGVRAMACGPDGNLIDDFLIETRPRVINVLNAPSPAATASLAIGETIAKQALAELG